MIYKIKYNSQRNNKDFNGKFPGWKQCFSTSAWMFMSFFTSKVDALDDSGLAEYLDDVEVKIGNPGIAEEVFKEDGFSSFWWTVQKAGIQKWLNKNEVMGKAMFKDCVLGFHDIKELFADGPVIVGTNKLGGLPGGHIILIVGYDDTGFIAKDPYGDANTNYKNMNGDNVHYDFPFIMPHMIFKMPDKIRCIYFQREAIA